MRKIWSESDLYRNTPNCNFLAEPILSMATSVDF